MSVVISNVKNLYKKALIIEFFCVFLLIFVFYFFSEQGLSCLLGVLAALLPQILFTAYFLYFQQKQSALNKAKVLYQSEGLKFGLTISLFILFFKLFDIQPLGLFIGFFITIFLNILIPVLLTVFVKPNH